MATRACEGSRPEGLPDVPPTGMEGSVHRGTVRKVAVCTHPYPCTQPCTLNMHTMPFASYLRTGHTCVHGCAHVCICQEYGAFVDLDNGLGSGLVHVSQVSFQSSLYCPYPSSLVFCGP